MLYVGVVVDMTRYAESEARLWYLSHHDGVTRLPNQTLSLPSPSSLPSSAVSAATVRSRC
ncbi:MAG: GGDEF domain protein [uncultured Paraburkholderia sp.]|nr:MAG: GGDEF domain protein [uncultured Paraburkholderia sp.]CAH2914813.1 MAG: GGDEF domain protein [uncultured Paraburkholderia sp.]